MPVPFCTSRLRLLRIFPHGIGFAALLALLLFAAEPVSGQSAPPFALRLDGADDRAEVRDSRNLDFPGPFTVEAWIRPAGWGADPEGGFGRILDKSTYLLFLNRRGTDYMDRSLVFFLNLANGNGIGASGPADAVALGIWTHVAVSYDGRSAVTMAIDGKPVPVFQPAGPPEGPVADGSWSPLFIGDSPNQPRFFQGDIGPVRIWSEVRSPEAIAADRFSTDLAADGLVASWPMAAGEGSTVADGSGNGNDGEIFGATWVDGPTPDADADGDGVPDGSDDCPLDPGKTDPGACGCGVSDADADGDGIADCVDPNQSPDAPVLVYPPDDLFPVDAWPLTLRTGPFSDADAENVLAAAQWQIAGADGFSPPLFEVRTEGAGTQIELPPLLLEGGAAYRWRVRHFDETGDASPWSAEFRFSTRADAGDADRNGVPDDQEPEPGLDLDGNGVPDANQPGLLAAETAAGTGPVTLRSSSGVRELEALAAFAPEALSPSASYAEVPLGWIGVRFSMETVGGLALLFLDAPVAIPEDAPWLAWSGDGGWIDIRGQISLTPAGSRTLRFIDGGSGDLDGTANGRVVFLLGPGDAETVEPEPEAEPSDDGGGGGGCFVESCEPAGE